MKGFRGYRFLLGPEQLLLAPHRPVRTLEEYRLWQGHLVTKRGGNPWESPAPVEAYVNHGRWVADCRWCGTGMFTRPDWAVAYCAECGAKYDRGKVKFPPTHEEIAKLLCRRVRRDQQNWKATQSVEDLCAENELIREAEDGIALI